MQKKWLVYKQNLAKTMTSLKASLTVMSAYQKAIIKDYVGFRKYIIGLNANAMTVRCRDVFKKYISLTAAITNCGKQIGVLKGQISSYTIEFSKWSK